MKGKVISARSRIHTLSDFMLSANYTDFNPFTANPVKALHFATLV